MSDTPIYGSTELQFPSSAPEVPINNMIRVVERAANSEKNWVVVGDFTASQTEMAEGFMHVLTGVPAAPFAFGVYPVARFFGVRNETTKTCTVYVGGLSGVGFDIAGGAKAVLHSDGVNIISVTDAFRGCRLKKAVDETTANYTGGVAIPFTAEDFDTDSFHDNAVNNTRITIPTGASFIELWGTVGIQLTTSATFQELTIRKNGSEIVGAKRLETTDTVKRHQVDSAGPVACVAGDYFELFLQEETDASITVEATYTRFGARIVG